MRKSVYSLGLLAALLGAGGALAEPVRLSTQGQLLDANDLPVSHGGATLGFSIWQHPDSGSPLSRVWPATGTSDCTAPVAHGLYSVVLDGARTVGCGAGLSTEHVSGGPRYLQVTVNGVELMPRMQLGAVPVAMVASRALDADSVGGETPSMLHDASRLTGIVPSTALGTGSTGLTTVGTITAGTWRGSPIEPAFIQSLDASKIGTGTFLPAHIPDLNASKITTGTFAAAQIPALDASKLTTGSFVPALIPSLDASKITTGTFAATQIPSLDASKITTGTINKARLPTLTAADVGAMPAVGGGIAGDLTVSGAVQIGTSSDPCSSSGSHGKLRWANNSLEVCTPGGWIGIGVGKNGSSQSSAGVSCKKIHDDFPTLPSGAFWINPTSSSAYRVYCDMSTYGGGWTLVLKANGPTLEHNHAAWTTTALLNETTVDDTWVDAKYQSFNDLPADFILAKSQNGGTVHLGLPSGDMGKALLTTFQKSATTLLSVVAGAATPTQLVNGQSLSICGQPFRINSRGSGSDWLRLGGWLTHTWDCSYGADSSGQPTSAELVGFGLRDDQWGPYVYNRKGFGVRQAHDSNAAPGGGQVSVGGALYVR